MRQVTKKKEIKIKNTIIAFMKGKTFLPLKVREQRAKSYNNVLERPD